MHVFLSAIEGAREPSADGGKFVADILISRGISLKYNLVSYFALDKDKNRRAAAFRIRDNSEEVLVDSGAHSFQKGKKVSWDEYTERYAEFIKSFDMPNVVGFFEMDVDKVIGLDKVTELRHRLEKITDKIIPVWHKGRGIDDYKKMCESHRGRVVAITGFMNEDIRDEQYMMFLKYARKFGCRVHCLGMTRKKILEKVPFDYTDSSTWLQRALYGMTQNNAKRRVSRDFLKNHRGEVYIESYLNAMQEQKYYAEKWSTEFRKAEKLQQEQRQSF